MAKFLRVLAYLSIVCGCIGLLLDISSPEAWGVLGTAIFLLTFSTIIQLLEEIRDRLPEPRKLEVPQKPEPEIVLPSGKNPYQL